LAREKISISTMVTSADEGLVEHTRKYRLNEIKCMYGYGELAEMFPSGLNGGAVYDGKVPGH
jgi:hypothetical protein